MFWKLREWYNRLKEKVCGKLLKRSVMLQELVKSGKYTWEEIEKKVEIKDGWLIWKWNLDIKWTSVKKIKIKIIEWYLSAENVESLEEIEVEKIWSYLDIEWTSVKKIKAEIIGWDLYARNVKSLKEIEVEVIWSLDIRWTSVEEVKAKRIEWRLDAEWVKSLKKIEVEEIWWKLNIEWTRVKKIKAKRIGWDLKAKNVKSLEEIEVEEIRWDLDIRWTSIEFQLKVIEKIKKWELKVNWGVYFWWDVEWIEKLVENENLVIPWSLDISWTNIKKIKVKIIEWYLSAENVESLEKIEVEEIWWDLNIEWTRVKKIKAEIIGSLHAKNVKSLEEIEVKEIRWNLDIRWTNAEFQLKVIEKIKKWELKVNWRVYFWWYVEW